MPQIRRLIILMAFALSASLSGHAISFALDSIAEWGKFPRFCINVYRWGDQFFNGYDTEYVTGAGYKFNIKEKNDSWIDYYNFDMPDNMRMRMISKPSTSAGLWLTYLAVSVGYDKSFSHLFGGSDNARQQFAYGFNCSLFTVNLNYIDNKVGTRISKFGPRGDTMNPHLDFNGVETSSLTFDLYYFFDHKRYSQTAAFNFSRIQIKSHGSWFLGFSYYRHKYNFDFNELPDYIKEAIPLTWTDYTYRARSRNYTIKFGYGYNWAFAPHWLMGVSESPIVGIRKGYINTDVEKSTFAMANVLKLSVVWNHKRWFAGFIGDMNFNIVYDKDSTFENASISGSITVGYRFDIW